MFGPGMDFVDLYCCDHAISFEVVHIEDSYTNLTLKKNEDVYFSVLAISFKVIHRTKHTLLIEAKQKIELGQIKNFTMRIQVSLDAKLSEVISFQGEKAVPHFMKILKTQSKDEKIQQNRFLTEWLESIFLSGINTEYKIK